MEEAEFAGRLYGLLSATQYFRTHPENLITADSHGYPLTRSVVALVRGTGRRTVVLAGHFDTVSVANYGTLAPLAFDPVSLCAALIAELEDRPRNGSEDRVLADLKSGSFMPGRGLLDMKSGLAAGIAAMERFAELAELTGNLLFIATPDEENASRGMRSVRDALPEITRRFEIDIAGGINLDASSCEKDGEEGRAIYLGSIGKYLPFAFAVGRSTHAGYPFAGISAHLIAAEIVRAIDTNPELRDEAHGELSPAPVCLEVKDLRSAYDVTTPDRVWLAFNWLTHRRNAPELLNAFESEVHQAMDRAIAGQRNNSFRATGSAATVAGTLLNYAGLRERVSARGGADALQRLDALEAELLGNNNPLAVTQRLVDAAVTEASIEGPAVVVGFGGLHYPLVHLDRFGESGGSFHAAIRSIIPLIEERYGISIKDKQIFAGISDMSFLGHRQEKEQSHLLAANTPAAAYTDNANEDLLAFPVVNIGPWGRDYHQKWERMHAPYTFNVLPDLIFEAAAACLADVFHDCRI